MCGTCGCAGPKDTGATDGGTADAGTRIAVPGGGAPVPLVPGMALPLPGEARPAAPGDRDDGHRGHDHGGHGRARDGHDHGRGHDHDHDHGHGHGHPHGEAHPHPPGDTVTLEEQVLARNDGLAARNRAWLTARGIVAVNLMSSPGSGKTTLLERTVRDLAAHRPVAVVEGDQETLLDAERVRRTGCPVVQVNTGAGCHLDAGMVAGALTTLDPAPGSLVLVENVGNLVCPALFDLGEQAKVVLISVTEGTDKPLKYPYMTAAADLLVINKTDLLPYVDFDVDQCVRYARSVNPGLRVLTISATSERGLDDWYAWVAELFPPDSTGSPARSTPVNSGENPSVTRA